MRPTAAPGLLLRIHWSPGGTWAAANLAAEGPGAQGGLWLLAADGRTERRLVADRNAIGFSPDGRWIYGRSGKDVARVPVDGGAEEAWLTSDLPGGVCEVSGDSRRIACLGKGTSDVWLLENIDRLLPH